MSCAGLPSQLAGHGLQIRLEVHATLCEQLLPEATQLLSTASGISRLCCAAGSLLGQRGLLIHLPCHRVQAQPNQLDSPSTSELPKRQPLPLRGL